jgi:hypothetical protein
VESAERLSDVFGASERKLYSKESETDREQCGRLHTNFSKLQYKMTQNPFPLFGRGNFKECTGKIQFFAASRARIQ